jgi:hypothetical protein
MPRTRYPKEPRVCAACGLQWIQADGKAPRRYCSTTCRYDVEGWPRASSPPPPDEPVLPISIRRVSARLVTLTCAWCQLEAEVPHFPGPLPRYCSPDCRQDAIRAGASARMQRLRQRARQAEGGPRAPKRDGPTSHPEP